MQLQTDEFIRACARIDPTTRAVMAESLEKLRQALLEEMASTNIEGVAEFRGAVRVLKSIIHTTAHAAQLVRQLDERSARNVGMKLVP